MAEKKVTVAQIAEFAGVSSATVSRVLNRQSIVKESTAEKVRAAMDALGMEAASGRAAISKEHGIIIVNVVWLDSTFHNDITKGVQISAEQNGYHTLVYGLPITNNNIEDFCALLLKVQASGVILTSPLSIELLNRINAIAPVVQCCEHNASSDLPYVSIDDYSAARTATEYLISRGRNKLALINGPFSMKYARERQEGFLSVMSDNNLTVPNSWVIQVPDNSFDFAYSAVCHLFNSAQLPNGIFAVSDTYAAAVIRAAKRYAIKIPDDLMVVGFDNINLSLMTSPSITTISQPRYQLGYTACEILFERITSPNGIAKSMLLETELVVRESTASEIKRN